MAFWSSPCRRLNTTLNHLASNPVSASEEQQPLRYTFNNGRLSLEQRQFYEKNGYLVIRRLVPENILDVCKQRFVDVCEGKVPRGTMTVMRDISLAKRQGAEVPKGEHQVSKLQDWQDDEVLFEYCKVPTILDYAEAFCGPNIKSIHTMVINKPPQTGKTGRHPLHQDLVYFPFRPADRIVAVWTAMQTVNRENGCLVVVPGSHTGHLRHHGYPDWDTEGGANKAYMGITDLTEAEFEGRIHLPMEKGDTVFFHPLLIHGSGYNKTQGYRKSISCHYASSSCDYIDHKGTAHEEVAREVESIAKKKLGFDASFQDVWRLKSRLLRGEPGTL